MKQSILVAALVAVTLAVAGAHAQAQQASASVGRYPLVLDPAEALSRIKLPPGFEISLYHGEVPGARSLALSDTGTVFVGTRTDPDRKPIGKIYAVTNSDRDGSGDEVITLAEDLHVPNGVAWRNGNLYVAEINRILRYADIDSRLRQPPAPSVISDDFPDKFHHGWKYLRFGPDGRLYVPVGAPCNICEPSPGIGSIVSLEADGSDRRVVAQGIRNSVGFDFHPQTGQLWFTDNGRDLWGEDRPPEELNVAPVEGLHFGFPYRYGRGLVDDSFETTMADADFTGAALEFPAHNALLGMRFYRGKQFPQDYHGDLFIASHGSWNRKQPDGYKVYRVRMENGRATGWETFASGWLSGDGQYWGRPVDVEVLPDGSLLVSDDFAGVIYRISYSG